MPGGRLLAILIGACLSIAAAGAARAEPFQLSIATGGVTGVYYQIGAAVCRLLNDHPPAPGIDCRTEGSNGSVRNLINMRYDNVPMAVAQSDSLHDAVAGTGPFAGTGRDTEVRALFSLVSEAFMILSRGDQTATSALGLQGRRISIGSPASGTEVTFRRLMAARGWSSGDFAALTDIKDSLQATALCRNEVDAIAVVAANPSGSVQEATFTCAARIVPLSPSFTRLMVEQHPYYVPVVVPGGLYPNNPSPTETVGVRATLVAPARTPDEVVYAVTKTVFENLPELRTLHLAFARIDANEILRYCVFAPIHPGALRYFREQGLDLQVCPSAR
jgi:TRAP transporter TAXI family solute receptor